MQLHPPLIDWLLLNFGSFQSENLSNAISIHASKWFQRLKFEVFLNDLMVWLILSRLCRQFAICNFQEMDAHLCHSLPLYSKHSKHNSWLLYMLDALSTCLPSAVLKKCLAIYCVSAQVHIQSNRHSCNATFSFLSIKLAFLGFMMKICAHGLGSRETLVSNCIASIVRIKLSQCHLDEEDKNTYKEFQDKGNFSTDSSSTIQFFF